MKLIELFENVLVENKEQDIKDELRAIKSKLANLSNKDAGRGALENKLKRLQNELKAIEQRNKKDSNKVTANRKETKAAVEAPKTKTVSDTMSVAQQNRYYRMEKAGNWKELAQAVLSQAKKHDTEKLNKEELAKTLGVTLRTINKWLQTRKEFGIIKKHYGI